MIFARSWPQRHRRRHARPAGSLALDPGHHGARAGKDVYAEKPLSHTLVEGRACAMRQAIWAGLANGKLAEISE